MKEPTNSREFAKESRKGGKGISGQNEPNFQNRGNGISEIEGKAARVAVSESGSRTSFNRGNGISEIEGKAARVAVSESGSRTSFNRGNGISEIEGKAARVAVSESGSRTSFNWILFNSVDSVLCGEE
jgi:hypothetical protein